LEYTEAVYKHKDESQMCRILEKIVLMCDSESFDGVLITNTKGEKIAMKKIDFNNNYSIYDIGESPASFIEIEGR